MRHLIFILSAIITLSGYAQQHHRYCSKYKGSLDGRRLAVEDLRSDSVDIVHTSIWFDMRQLSSQHIEAAATLSIRAQLSGVTSCTFDLEGLQIQDVSGPLVSSFTQDSATFTVEFSTALPQTSLTELIIEYNGSPIKDASQWGGFYFQGDFAWNLGVGFASDPHSYGRIWFPCFDNFIERSTMDFEVVTPSPFIAACNGLFQGRDTNQDGSINSRWQLDQPIPSYLACVAVGNYAVLQNQHTGIEETFLIELHARASDTNKLKNSFIHLGDAIDAFEAGYGPYRFDKVGYSLVPFNAGAMEHATNITYPIYAANGNLSNESLMAHELAHMWWGDNITCQTDGDMWLNEGWASFSEYLFFEHTYDRARYENAMLEDLRFMLQYGHVFEEGYRPVSGQPHEYVYGDHVYKKGALVAHNLRGYLGDEVFFDAVSAFMEAFEFQPVSSDSLERFLTNHTGIDVSSFFRDWVYTGGYSVIVLDSFTIQPEGAHNRTTLHLQQKLKGRTEFHDDVPVYYTLYDSTGQTFSGMEKMSGMYAEIDVISSLEPAWIVLYAANELAQARTFDLVEISETGPLDVENMYWEVSVDGVSGTSDVLFEQIWSYPDPIKAYNDKPFKMNDYRYWRISGLNMDELSLSGFFFYDGRSSGSTGYLDTSLVGTTEDSLVLLYRSGPASDWDIYPHYEKNVMGLSDNGFGMIELSSILPGEYVLANQDHTVLSNNQREESSRSKVSVFPNPSSGRITVANPTDQSIQIRFYDLQGKLVGKKVVQPGEDTFQLDRASSGVVLYEYSSPSSTALRGSGKVILE